MARRGSRDDFFLFLQFFPSEPDSVRARYFTEKHLALRRELSDLDGQIIAHMSTAAHEFWSGDQLQANQLCKAAMEIAIVVKNRWGLSAGHSILGDMYRASGEAKKSIEHCQWQLNAMGCANGAKREWPVAERDFQQAIDLAQTGRLKARCSPMAAEKLKDYAA